MKQRRIRAQKRAQKDARMQRLIKVLHIYQVARATYGDHRPVYLLSAEQAMTPPRPIAPVCEPTPGGRYTP